MTTGSYTIGLGMFNVLKLIQKVFYRFDWTKLLKEFRRESSHSDFGDLGILLSYSFFCLFPIIVFRILISIDILLQFVGSNLVKYNQLLFHNKLGLMERNCYILFYVLLSSKGRWTERLDYHFFCKLFTTWFYF